MVSGIGSMMSSGVSGIMSGQQRAQSAAQTIAQQNIQPQADAIGDLTKAMVNLQASERQVQASSAVVKTADEVLGTIIDTTA